MNLWEELKELLADMLWDCIDSILSQLQHITGNIIRSAFLIEESSGLSNSLLNADSIQFALSMVYLFTIALLALKLCWQGWKVYVLWRDGEAENSPANMLINSIYALCIAMAFPTLYKIAVEIALGIDEYVAYAFPSGVMGGSSNIISIAYSMMEIYYKSGGLSASFAMVIISLAYIILFVILIFSIMIRSAAMLIYRIGIPLAVIGLVNSDGGIWKNYIQILFQHLAIVLIQNFCIRLSLFFIYSASFTSFVFAIIFAVSAFKIPKIFASVLQTGGGTGGQIIYTVIMAARAFRGSA